MFQVITIWNLARPDQDMKQLVDSISLRGYSTDAVLTGEFARGIRDRALAPLSVGDIADRRCPARRDLYIRKGKNRPKGVKPVNRWGKPVGSLVEKYIWDVFSSKMMGKSARYDNVRKRARKVNKKFTKDNKARLQELKELEGKDESVTAGDSEWLFQLLDAQGRAELAQHLLHKTLSEIGSMAPEDVVCGPDAELQPNAPQIGINSPSTPDFIIPSFHIIGDVKTGISFHNGYLITCAGYALSYENSHADSHKNIDWGIIYFFPTRTPVRYIKPITFPQIYIFPIDDSLRSWFLEQRNQDYQTISRHQIPGFPEDKSRCRDCTYQRYCEQQGLQIEH